MARERDSSKGKGKGKGRSSGKGKADGKGKEVHSTGKGKGKGKAKHIGYASNIPGMRWVEKSFRKMSMFATQSFEDMAGLSSFPGDARVAQLRTCSEMLGILECVFVEPPQKKLVPQAFCTTGVIICLHGMPPSQSVLEEWGRAATAAGWAELSCSIVIPNVQMSAALQLSDFEAIVDAALELADFDRCLLVGKAWGAQRVVEIAAADDFNGKVEGVILIAPSSPAPEMSGELEVPALLVWAGDDEVSSFDECEAWKEALDGRVAPTSFCKCSAGGHHLGDMLDDNLSAQVVRNFTAAALLVGELELQQAEPDDSVVHVRSNRERRLSGELPRFAYAGGKEEEDPDDDDDEEDEDKVCKKENGATVANTAQADEKRKSVKSMGIMNWMAAGMTTATE